jgi:hypothetical protein
MDLIMAAEYVNLANRINVFVIAVVITDIAVEQGHALLN